MPDKIRFYTFARTLGEKPKSLHAKVKNLGFSIKSYMSSVTPQQVEAMTKALADSAAPQPQPTPPRRRTTPKDSAPQAATPVAPSPQSPPAEPSAPEGEPSTGRVVRDERGVIVGTKRRSEPKILGYIKVPPRPRRKVEVVKTKPKAEGRASRRKEREERKRQAQRRSAARERSRRRTRRRRASHTEPRRPEHRVIPVDGSIVLGDLAHAMSKTVGELKREGHQLGLRRLSPQQRVDVEVAEVLAEAFGWRVDDRTFDESAMLQCTSAGEPVPRAPVVTVMGHVDHGKTSLLDAIRDTRVAKREAGGITQHIGAYRVEHEAGSLVFLDTPGHEAFDAMRARGAMVTDIVVLVVAADDGIMPTTLEAIAHAREAEVPIVVALTKVDLPTANPGRVKQQLMEHRLIGEEFGGDTILCEVSAVTGQGVDDLLESLLLQAELMELRARLEGRARGVVLESRVRKGHGPTCTVLVQAGTLRPGDIIVADHSWGKVRRLLDPQGRVVKSARPSTPVTVVGLDSPPGIGRPAVVVEDGDAAKRILAHREARKRQAMRPRNVLSIDEFRRRRQATLLPVLIKADVAGSIEAVQEVLDSIEVDGVQLDVVGTGLGPITEGDVKLAAASGATVVGFAVKADARGATAARQLGVELESSRVIYELADAVHSRMQDLLEPVFEAHDLGTAEVRALFKVPSVGKVAGVRVLDGELVRGARARVVRGGQVVHEGALASLKVHKDDMARVGAGRECGLTVAGFSDLRPDDRIEVYDLREAAGS